MKIRLHEFINDDWSKFGSTAIGPIDWKPNRNRSEAHDRKMAAAAEGALLLWAEGACMWSHHSYMCVST